MPLSLKVRHSPEQLDRLIEAVRRFRAPWIVDINKLNRVFQSAHNLVYGPRELWSENIEMLLETVQTAEETQAKLDAEGIKKKEGEDE